MRSARQGDLTVRKTTLPQQICFCRQFSCKDLAEAASNLRDTYIATARTGKMSMNGRMFTMRTLSAEGTMRLQCCIPTEEDFDGPERVEFAETSIASCGGEMQSPLADFAAALRKADRAIVTDVDGAREQGNAGLSARLAKDAGGLYVPLAGLPLALKSMNRGVIVLMGAGDFSSVLSSEKIPFIKEIKR